MSRGYAPAVIDTSVAYREDTDEVISVMAVAGREQWNVKREYLRRMKKAFEQRGVEIPFPHLTLYAGTGKRGEAPSLPVRVADAAVSTVAQRT